MNCTLARSLFFALALVSPAVASEATVALFQEYCLDCHGEDVQKAGLRLDTIKADYADPASFRIWMHVHDRLRAGTMPPENKKQPAKADVVAALKDLAGSLQTASLHRQETQGRVVLRRLNGTEYENTIRELMGTNVAVKDLLPEDNTAAGFDNVSAALELSATHFLLYQEAAEKAVLSAIPPHPPFPFKDRRTGRQMSEKGPNFQQTLTRSCYLKDDALIVYSKLPRYGLAATPAVPAAGRYRVRMSVAAVGAKNDPVPAAFQTVDGGREAPITREVRDFQPGKPKLIELETDLEARQAFVINFLGTWDIRQFKKPIEEYTGPGLLIEWLEIEGPVGEYPPQSYQNLFGEVPLKARSVARAEAEGRKPPTIQNRQPQSWVFDPLIPVSTQPKEDAEKLIRAFLPRAFRRPVSEEWQKHYVNLVHGKLDAGDTFQDAMMFGYKSILTSPYFLFLLEPAGPLDDYALASRLSYFLWSSPPDAELLDLAAQKKLAQPAELRRQTERLLASPKAHRFTENFTGQWLDLRKMDATIPDPQLYGDFDHQLLWSMPRETYAFFEEILRKDLSLLNFVDSDWSMLNGRLAAHYGIPGVVGNDFRRVALPVEAHRGGVMTQASILKVTADGTTTSPILRGKWVLERLIGKPPSPPPPDVPALEPDIRGATTIRQQLEKHRENASCASCHNHIDPPGFALEQFDPIGGYREFYRAAARPAKDPVVLANYTGRPVYQGLPVEKGGVTPEGKAFETISDYQDILLEDKDQIARSLASKLMTYATGADVQFADREVIEQIVATLRENDYGFRALIHEIVQSRPFRNK